MATGAVNWKIAQEKSLGSLDDFGDVSEEVVAAFLSNRLPDKIQELASEIDDDTDKLWSEYQKIKGTNY